jgi:hypothetical protein
MMIEVFSMVDMIIKELVFDDAGNFVRMRGEFKKKFLEVRTPEILPFSNDTNKTMDWARFNIEYMGGGCDTTTPAKRTKFIDG